MMITTHTICCGLWRRCFFRKEEADTVNVNGPYYIYMTGFLRMVLDIIDISELWFQQELLTCYTSDAALKVEKEEFDHWVISRAFINLRLDTAHYFLWSNLNSLVYTNKPITLNELEVRIPDTKN